MHSGGFDRSDDDIDFAGGDLPEGGGALLLDVGVGERFSKGRTSWAGRRSNAVAGSGAGEFAAGREERLEGFGGFVVGDDDDDGMLGGAREEREIEGTGGAGESRDTPTTRTAS